MKKSQKALLSLVTLALIIVLLDSLGQLLRLYWSVWWFDVLMHFLGGAWAGLLLLSLSRYAPKPLRRFLPAEKHWFYYLAILAIGVGWEFYEVMVGLIVTPEPYPIDTSIDIVMDLLGAWGIRKIYMKRKNET